MALHVFSFEKTSNYVVVFEITTIREEKQRVIKKSYLIAAALVLWLLKETQAQLSTCMPHRGVVVKRQNGGDKSLTDFREDCLL